MGRAKGGPGWVWSVALTVPIAHGFCVHQLHYTARWPGSDATDISANGSQKGCVLQMKGCILPEFWRRCSQGDSYFNRGLGGILP